MIVIQKILEEKKIIKSKDIICTKRGDLCLIKFKGYKIVLNNRKNKEETIVSLDERDKTKDINENKIRCEICKEKNKEISYINKFYIWGIKKNIFIMQNKL